MSQPLVTVLIPCYNAADTVVRAIDSVRRQTYRPVEIIAIDDASTDNTRDILQAEAARGDVTLVALDKNLHSAGARNAGFAQSHGEFVALLDADDEFLPDKLARQVAVMRERPDVVFVTCDASNVALDGTVRTGIFSAQNAPIGPDGWRRMLARSNAMPSVMMARSSAYRQVGGFTQGIKLVDDQDFAIRVALTGAVDHVDEVLTRTHTQPTGMSHQSWRKDIEIGWPVIRSHIEAQSHRLSQSERRSIYGQRYARLGRNVYREAPLLGAGFIIRGALHGEEPLRNLWHLVSASPPMRALKAIIRGAG